ncbi:MAG: hypothetical protein AAF591_15660 [Verrucomicrobiota bacterium]
MRLSYPHPVALRWAALLTFLRITLLWFSLAFTAIALAAFHSLLPTALVLIASSVTIAVVAFLQSAPLRCVLCRCTLFLPKTCDKHPSTKRLLGSRLLRMCFDILFKPSFACVYCGERCGCRKKSKKFTHETAPDPSQLAQSARYQSLWQKPPPPTDSIASQPNRDPVMRGYSPFRILPDESEPGLTNPVPAATPSPPSSPAPAHTLPIAAPQDQPFTTAVDSWGSAYATLEGEVDTSPFRNLAPTATPPRS